MTSPASPPLTTTATDFAALGLDAALVQAVGAAGFSAATAIQAQAIPPALAGADVLGVAQTGSGKTVAFALPLLQHLLHAPTPPSRAVRALVLVPTRELAAQVGGVIGALARGLPRRLKVAIVFGGVSINPQMLALRGGADIVVATPGRLLDLVDHNALRLSKVGHLVLDEADRLLDLGFADELARVLALLPGARQNLLFSATFAPAVQTLAAGWLREPVRVDVAGDPADAPAIVQRAIRVDAGRRTELLRHLAREGGWSRGLVFVATQHAAEHVAWKLYQRGVHAAPFHGALSQGARTTRLAEFANGQWDLLVTTDLAARGIDVQGLDAVVNYDLPRAPADHVHRIGRTARAGASGLAVSFVTAEAQAHYRLIEKRQGLSLPLEQIEGFEPSEPAEARDAGANPAAALAQGAAAAPGTGGIKGRRPSKKDKLRAAARAAQAAQGAGAAGEPEADAREARAKAPRA